MFTLPLGKPPQTPANISPKHNYLGQQIQFTYTLKNRDEGRAMHPIYQRSEWAGTSKHWDYYHGQQQQKGTSRVNNHLGRTDFPLALFKYMTRYQSWANIQVGTGRRSGRRRDCLQCARWEPEYSEKKTTCLKVYTSGKDSVLYTKEKQIGNNKKHWLQKKTQKRLLREEVISRKITVLLTCLPLDRLASYYNFYYHFKQIF